MMTIMAGAVIAPSLPQMAQAFSYLPRSEALVKSVLTTHALFIILAGPIAGWLLDRIGRKPVLIGAMILYGLGGASGFVAISIYAVFAGRAVLGLAVAGLTAGFTTLIGDYFTGDERSRFMGIQASFVQMGGVVFIFIGGLLADVGWRFPFLIYLYSFLILPCALLFLYEPTKVASHARGDAPDEKNPMPYSRLLLVYALAWVGMVCFYMIPIHVPFYLRSLPQVTNTQVGVALALSNLIAAGVSFNYQRLKSRLSFRGLFGFFFGLLAAGYFIISRADSYSSVIAGLTVSGLGLGLLMPNLNVWLTTLIPAASRGRAMGGLTTCLYMGQFLCPILTQPLMRTMGMSSGFAMVSTILIVLGIGFGAWAFYDREFELK
jgi:MFS family permease